MAIMEFPIMYINDPSKGRPVFNGQIFVGIPDLDPEDGNGNPINSKQLNVIQEDGTVIPVNQPFILSAGGNPVYNGTPVRLDVAGNYSLKILDKLGVQTYYIENVKDSSSISDLSQAYIFDTVALFEASLIEFPDGKTIHLNDRDADFTKISGQSGSGGQIIPSTNVSQSASLILTNGNAKDVKAWGISGTNAINDTAYQEALDSDLGHIHFSDVDTSYKFLLSHDCLKDKSVTVAKGVVIDCSDAGFVGNHFTRFLGVLTQVADLSTDVAAQDFTLPMVDVNGLANDDVLVIWNPTGTSYATWPSRPNYYAGEYVQIQEIAALNVQIQSNLYDPYLAASVNVYRLDSPSCSFGGGGKLLGDLSGDLVVFEYCKNAYVGGYEFNHSNNSGLAFKRCFNCHGERITGYNIGDGGDDYGISFGNSQDCSIDDSSVYSRRHAVTMGGGSSAGSVPCRNIRIKNSNLRNDTDSNVHCADFHGNVENCSYEHCDIFGGVTWQGKNNGFKKCRIQAMPAGYILLAAEIKGGLFYLDDCECFATGRPQDGSRGYVDLGGNSTVISSGTVEDVTLRSHNTEFNLINEGAGSYLFQMKNRGTTNKINWDIKSPTVKGALVLGLIRTELISGTADSDFLSLTNVMGNLPIGTTLASHGSGTAYRGFPHKLPSLSGSETVTTNTGENTTTGTPVLFRWTYPKTPNYAGGRANRGAIGGEYGFETANPLSTTGLTMVLRNEKGTNWAAAADVDLSWRVGIDEF